MAMEVSSTSMNAAKATVAATSHGLVFGFQEYMSAFAAASAILVGYSSSESV